MRKLSHFRLSFYNMGVVASAAVSAVPLMEDLEKPYKGTNKKSHHQHRSSLRQSRSRNASSSRQNHENLHQYPFDSGPSRNSRSPQPKSLSPAASSEDDDRSRRRQHINKKTLNYYGLAGNLKAFGKLKVPQSV